MLKRKSKKQLPCGDCKKAYESDCLLCQADLAKQAGRLNVAHIELASAQEQLDDKQVELDKVQDMYDAAMKEKQVLVNDAESCMRSMTSASAPIGGSAGKKVIWREQSKQFKSQIDSKAFIYGLHLDGAGCDKRNCHLCEHTAKVVFTPLTVVHAYAINSTAPKDPRLYQCPVYKKPNRTDLTYISFIVLKTTQSPDHWILRGVAALCEY